MSNYLAIATVTAALQRALQATVQVDVDGARVTTMRPNSLGSGTPETGVNIYLYQAVRNPVWRNNANIKVQNRKGEMAKRSQNALDLHYMISFYGSEVELEPQRLLGSVVRTLNDYSTLTTEMIQDTLNDSNFSYLSDSTLMDQVEEINFLPLDLSLEDLSKIWSVFFQTPYALSLAYKATVVMIEGEEAGQKALPVRERRVGLGAFFYQPTITEVLSEAGKFEPILADSTLLIRGKNLKNNITLVRLGKIEVTPTTVSETQITLSLSFIPANFLRVGVQSLQVVHRISTSIEPISNNGNAANETNSRGQSTLALSSQPAINRGVESNVLPFVLRPSITDVNVSHVEGSGDEPHSVNLTVQVNLTIGKKQKAVLALNEWSIDNPAAYLFDASPRRSDTNSITFKVRHVKPGEYLLRLHVDGAESQLSIDTNSDSPTFNWYIAPRVLIGS